MNENDDLRLLAEFREDLPEATPQRLAAVRAAFVNQSLKGRRMTARQPFFTPKRIALVGIPAVAAIALGVAAVALNTGGTNGAPGAGPGTNTAIEQHVLDPNADAAAVFEYMSYTTAKNGNAPGIAPGQLIVSHDKGFYHSVKNPAAGQIQSETWIWWDPFKHMSQVKVVDVENGEERVTRPDNTNGKTGEEQLMPVGVQNPTPEYVQALPTDPDAMIAQFREEFRKQVSWDWISEPKSENGHYAQPGTEEYQKAQDEADGMLFMDLKMILSISDYAMTAEQRATMWEAIAELANVTRTPGTVQDPNGREGIAIGVNAINGSGGRYEIIVDPETSKVIGERVLEADGSVRSFTSTDTALVASTDDKG